MYVVNLTLCTDAELTFVYNQTSGETSGPMVEALLVKIERRDLDI